MTLLTKSSNVKEALDNLHIFAESLTATQVGISNPNFPESKNVSEVLDEINRTVEQALAILYDTDMAAHQLANRIYEGVDLTVKFALEIAAFPTVWDWIKSRIQAADFANIYIGDYIPFVAGDNLIKSEVAGIDTYYRYGDPETGHHIDFISRDCWPDKRAFNKAAYNNGTTVSPHPWLASDLYAYLNSLQMNVPNTATANPTLVSVDYRATGVFDKFPAALKNVITPKRAMLPQRYTAGALLTADNSWGWTDVGKLWIPSEIEVFGCEHFNSKKGISGSGFQQYPIFANNMKRIKGAGDGGVRTAWRMLDAVGVNSTNFSIVFVSGEGSSSSATTASILAPVCFRIT